MDIAFVIDTSSSVRNKFNSVKKFFLQLVDSFTISSQYVRVGLVVNSIRPQVKISFGQYNSPNQIKRIIQLLQPVGGAPKTGKALKLAFKRLFNASKGKKTLIFLTAGKSSDPVLGPVQQLVAMGVDIFSVGVGPAASRSEVLTVAKDPQHAYETNVRGLGTIAKRVKDKACAGAFISLQWFYVYLKSGNQGQLNLFLITVHLNKNSFTVLLNRDRHKNRVIRTNNSTQS